MTDIKKIREKRGISQKELATKLNVSPSTVSQWENGLRNPSLVNVKRMSNILHCTTDEILSSVVEEFDDSKFHGTKTEKWIDS